MDEPKPKARILRDQPNGLDPVVVQIWPDGDVVLKQGANAIQISEKQVAKLIEQLSN